VPLLHSRRSLLHKRGVHAARDANCARDATRVSLFSPYICSPPVNPRHCSGKILFCILATRIPNDNPLLSSSLFHFYMNNNPAVSWKPSCAAQHLQCILHAPRTQCTRGKCRLLFCIRCSALQE
jgi:hypothetical protein